MDPLDTGLAVRRTRLQPCGTVRLLLELGVDHAVFDFAFADRVVFTAAIEADLGLDFLESSLGAAECIVILFG